jgi:hypothetical protein
MPKRWALASALLTATALAPTAAHAIGDRTSRTEGQVIVHAGEASPLNCPAYGNYDCTKWPTSLYKMNDKNVCFESSDVAYSCGYSCNVLFAVNKQQVATLFVVERSRLTTADYTMYRCPSVY